jgi:hypothetical protein
MESEHLLPFSKAPANGTFLEPVESNPHPDPISYDKFQYYSLMYVYFYKMVSSLQVLQEPR